MGGTMYNKEEVSDLYITVKLVVMPYPIFNSLSQSRPQYIPYSAQGDDRISHPETPSDMS